MVAVALGLAASASWGLADFIGGLKARKLDLLAVLGVSQFVALALLGVVIAASGEPAPELSTLAVAGGAGAVGVAGLGALYRGLAIGAMAVVAPIAALGAAIPVAVGVATGDSLGALQGAGIALALGGVALVAREEAPEGGGAGWRWAPAWRSRQPPGSACSSWEWTPRATTASCGRCSRPGW